MPLSDNTIDNVAEKVAKRYSDVESELIKLVGRRIGAIGQLLPSDATALARLRDIGGDITKIIAMLQRTAELTAAELDAIFAATAAHNLLFAKKLYEVRDVPYIPYAQNRPLQRIVEAQTRLTYGVLENISQTTVMNSGGIDRNADFHPIAVAYRTIVDKAIIAVQSGVTDYNSAVRDILGDMARSGLRTVEYASGHKRRLDSAVRMNLVDGVRAVNQSCAEQIGVDIAADGVELTAHMTCAPDHLPMQGRQFSKEEFEKLQSEQPSTDYKGNRYEPIRRRIGIWNCRHFAYPIILGVSKPVYSDMQLTQLVQDNNARIDIGGKEYTAYEASQLMRQVETQIRAAKNETVAFEASGDIETAMIARNKVRQLTNMYEGIAKSANQRMKYARIRVPGYR